MMVAVDTRFIFFARLIVIELAWQFRPRNKPHYRWVAALKPNQTFIPTERARSVNQER
jgi:hypothetical protein